jgi:hypothetical protein
MIAEISRVLAPNGIFIEVTFGTTAERLSILDDPGVLPWTLEASHTVLAQAGKATVFVFRKFKEIISVVSDAED